jgi:hypothetical protein
LPLPKFRIRCHIDSLLAATMSCHHSADCRLLPDIRIDTLIITHVRAIDGEKTQT